MVASKIYFSISKVNWMKALKFLNFENWVPILTADGAKKNYMIRLNFKRDLCLN